MERKTFKFDLKTIGEEGQFEGYLSVFGNVDRGDPPDVVERGAFKRTLDHWKQKGKPVPYLYWHDPKTPVGALDELNEDDHGLYVKGRLLLGIEKARDVRECMKAGVISEMSIGYDAVQAQRVKGIRYLKEIKLYEGSCVTTGFAMNPLASVTSVKAGTPEADDAPSLAAPNEVKAGEFAGALNRIRRGHDLCRERWELLDALNYCMDDCLSGDDAPDVKAATIDAALGEFHAAALAWAKEAIAFQGTDKPEPQMPGMMALSAIMPALQAKALLGALPAPQDSAAGHSSAAKGAAEPGPAPPPSGDSESLHSLRELITNIRNDFGGFRS